MTLSSILSSKYALSSINAEVSLSAQNLTQDLSTRLENYITTRIGSGGGDGSSKPYISDSVHNLGNVYDQEYVKQTVGNFFESLSIG